MSKDKPAVLNADSLTRAIEEMKRIAETDEPAFIKPTYYVISPEMFDRYFKDEK